MKKERLSFIGLSVLVLLLGIFSLSTHLVGNKPHDSVNSVTQVKAHQVNIARAYGDAGKQTLTLVTDPVNADLGVITWSVDNEAVTVTPVDNGKSAEVKVSTHFANYATITVHEQFSDITATGKVYSYGKTVLDPVPNLAHGSTASVIISNTENRATTAGVYFMSPTTTWITNTIATIRGEWDTPNSGYVYNANTVYLHISYDGSYAPQVWNKTSNALFQVSNDVAKNAGAVAVTIPVTLSAGVNELLLIGRTGPTVPAKPASVDDIDILLGGFAVTNASAAQSVTIPDLTFYS